MGLDTKTNWLIVGRNVTRTQNPASRLLCLLHTGFLHAFFFDPEDGGDMFLRKVGWLSTDYTALHTSHKIELLV
jgi:hypothetical protein